MQGESCSPFPHTGVSATLSISNNSDHTCALLPPIQSQLFSMRISHLLAGSVSDSMQCVLWGMFFCCLVGRGTCVVSVWPSRDAAVCITGGWWGGCGGSRCDVTFRLIFSRLDLVSFYCNTCILLAVFCVCFVFFVYQYMYPLSQTRGTPLERLARLDTQPCWETPLTSPSQAASPAFTRRTGWWVVLASLLSIHS